MIRFSQRVSIPEKMDDPALPEEALTMALSDIRKVNRYLGGHTTSLKGLRSFLDPDANTPLHIIDMGCGDGEFLRVLARHCRKLGVPVTLIGWDMNPKSLAMARRASATFPEIRYECQDVLGACALPENSLITCNLFLHHFSSPQVSELLCKWKDAGASAVIINDLHRNALAYYLFRLFGAIFMKSPVARYDGAVSIRRGFRKGELLRIFEGLNASETSIRWYWAFRWLCCIRNT